MANEELAAILLVLKPRILILSLKWKQLNRKTLEDVQMLREMDTEEIPRQKQISEKDGQSVDWQSENYFSL